MRALKVMVIVMGVLLAVGFTVVIVALANRMTSDKKAVGFGEITLPVPEGCGIAEATSDGERVILRLEGLAERGCREVVIVDLESGAVLGRIQAVIAP